MKELIEMALAADRIKYPTFPDRFRVKPKYTDKTANGLTKCIIDYLNFKGHQAERISSTGRLIDNRQTYTNVIGQQVTIGSTKWIPGSSTNGTADISATINGRSVKIEVKIKKDTQSDDQREYQAAVERAGGIYIITKDFSSFLQWYNAANL